MNKEQLINELNVQRDIWMNGAEVASNLAMRAINSLLEELYELVLLEESYA